MVVTVCAGCSHVHVGRVCECGCEDWSKLVGVLDEAPPPSEPAPVTDAEAEAWQAKLQGRATRMPAIAKDAEWQAIHRLLADRARYQERELELEQCIWSFLDDSHPVATRCPAERWQDCDEPGCLDAIRLVPPVTREAQDAK